jgi:hypothetical protein
LKFEILPFSLEPTLALYWGNWLARVSYEEGKEVENDVKAIKERTNSAADFSAFHRQIRIVFSDDDEKLYTNEIIYLLDYLQQIEGILVYDLQQNDFIE